MACSVFFPTKWHAEQIEPSGGNKEYTTFKFFKNRDPKAALSDVLGEFQLPSFPAAAHEALRKLRDPDGGASDVADVLAQDPGLSVAVLTQANSAAMGSRRKIEDLGQAVALLGFPATESLVLSGAVAKTMPSKGCGGFEPSSFWMASSRRAMLAKRLSRRLCPADENQSYTAALLQDMAVPFLAHAHEKDYSEIIEHWTHHPEDLTELERQRFQWDHAEVATWIADAWKLPEPLALAIGSHHGAPLGEEIPPSVVLVHYLRNGDSDPIGEEQLIETAHRDFSVDKDDVVSDIEEATESAAELARLFVSK